MMLATRSGGTVDDVRSTRIKLPGLSSSLLLPGSQLTKYSPTSDCGMTWHSASLRSEPKPVSVTVKVMIARLVSLSTLSSLILPARTPATLKSPPSIRPNASSNSTQ